MVCASQQILDSIVCGYGKANRDAAMMVMFKAYFDDSCSNEDKQIFVLAGCVQKYKVWADFSMSWEAALVRTPSIRWLHMREARSLSGEFAGWKGSERDKKIRFLAGVIESFRPWTIATWVSRKEHDEILKPNQPYMVRQAYFSLFYSIILKLAQWHHDMEARFPVDYVFDIQGQIGEDAALWHRHIRSWQKPEIADLIGGTPKFEDDKIVLPLQAADMLAWHIRRRKEHPEQASSLPTSPLENLSYAESHLSKEWLTAIAEKTKQVPNFELVRDKTPRANRNEIRDLIRQIPTKAERERQKRERKNGV